ncbi:MAG: SRPBCC family protein [Cyclobacteriaceae bacterium]|nr:SRPBCC family protein [Cyclobacteriaceae bacterium]
MKIHYFEIKQKLPVDLPTAWEFFSSPKNLNAITPEDMNFKIVSGAESRAYAGQIITYRVSPMWGIILNWVTEISQCVEGKYFIDEQRFGPYKFWHHQHHFEETADGVIMTDILHYALPFGWLGELLGNLFIHRKVQHIFDFREKKLLHIFIDGSKSILA